MPDVRKTPALAGANIPVGIVQVCYPDPCQWRTGDFYALAEAEIQRLKGVYADYDRKALFGEHPYYRFFKKFKKTYPVMLQLESLLFKGRPFPRGNPASEVAFLAEVETLILSGAHDAERIEGTLELYLADAKEPFPGLRGEPAHTYPGDVCGRDEKGVIFSMIAGADARTCVRPDSRYILYPVFGLPGQDPADLEAFLALTVQYANVLSPGAAAQCAIL